MMTAGGELDVTDEETCVVNVHAKPYQTIKVDWNPTRLLWEVDNGELRIVEATHRSIVLVLRSPE